MGLSLAISHLLRGLILVDNLGPEGWPDFIYSRDVKQNLLVIELGRLLEGRQERRFENNTEQFGEELKSQLLGKLPGFYILQLPYDLQLPNKRGKAKATKQILDTLAQSIISAAKHGQDHIDIPVPCDLIKVDKPDSGIFVTPTKRDFMDDEGVLRNPVYYQELCRLLVEANCKSTGFDKETNILVLDVTDSKMDHFILTMLAHREWNLDTLVPSRAPRLKEIWLCEGVKVWSGGGGRILSHKYKNEIPSRWIKFWPGKMGMQVVSTKAR